jgi:hypothetical protein
MFLPPQFDTKRFEKLERENNLELNRLGKEREAAAVKASARIKRNLLAHVESQRKDLERLEKLALLDPFLIFAKLQTASGSLEFDFDLQQHWAKMKFAGKQPSPSPWDFDNAELSFYYQWTNDSNYPIRISATSSLLLNGFCRARADGWWGAWAGNQGYEATLQLRTSLRAWQWWTNPPIPFPGSPGDVLDYEEVVRLEVEGGIWASVQEREIVEFDFFSVSNIEVPPRGSVVFQVSLLSSYSFNGSGETLVDFWSGSFLLSSQYLSLSIGRPPIPHPFPFPFPP